MNQTHHHLCPTKSQTYTRTQQYNFWLASHSFIHEQSQCINWCSHCSNIASCTRISRKEIYVVYLQYNSGPTLPQCTMFTGNSPASIIILVNVWDNSNSWCSSCRPCCLCLNICAIFIELELTKNPLDSLLDVSSPLFVSQRFWILASVCRPLLYIIIGLG